MEGRPSDDSPTIAVAVGIRRRRVASHGMAVNRVKDSVPMMSGILAPPASPKKTNGLPAASACS